MSEVKEEKCNCNCRTKIYLAGKNGGGKVVDIDPEFYEELVPQRWMMTAGGYACRGEGKKFIYMHRLIVGAKKGQIVDHINGNRLDNRRLNLRFVTHSQNLMNIRKPKFKGVYWNARIGKFLAHISMDGKMIRLGWYEDADEAAYVRDQVALQLHGSYAAMTLNLLGED